MSLSDTELQALLQLLARIASGLCRDAGVSRVVLSTNDRWAWNADTHEIHVGRDTLARDGVEVCAGIIAHEVGHSFLSRYHMAKRFNKMESFQSDWMNALEDTRVERWMTLRYPGVADWLTSTTDAALTSILQSSHKATARHTQWMLAVCFEGMPHAENLYETLHPDVRMALDTTRLARVRYRDGFLPTSDGHDWGLAHPNRDSAWTELQKTYILPNHLDLREQHIVTLSLQALLFAERHILPTVRILLEQDIAELGRVVAADPMLQHALSKIIIDPIPNPNIVLSGVRRGTIPSKTADQTHLTMAQRWLELASNQTHKPEGWLNARMGPPSTTAPHSFRDFLSERPEIPQPIAPSRHALVVRVERAFSENLRKERLSRQHHHTHLGTRADLRRVLHNEGPFARDPSRWVPAFQRPTRMRSHAVFGLLIDCSGSMNGPKVQAAVEAAHIFIEALQRVGVPYWVAGFQDELIPLAETGCTLAEARTALAGIPLEVRGTRPGGHNHPMNNDDGPCLLKAAAHLRRIPAAQRVLLVLSDGRPAGRHSTPADLHAAVRTLARDGDIDLLGVGIGATHVAEFYPRHIVVDPIERLPEAVATALMA